MSEHASLALVPRVLLALALSVGFYALALGLAGFLLSVPILEYRQAGRLHPQVILVCGLSAGAIVWSILPRSADFVDPGPTLDRDKEPTLFAVIDEVAAATGQQAPAEVYLIPGVSAFVAERGGFLGVGSRRFMALGLPVFAALTVSELRAVLAHEFGHYAGGDTRLGGILYSTQAAILRTFENLRSEHGRTNLLQWPFHTYGTLFFRLTRAVAREQERGADRIAARVTSPEALSGGLRKMHVLDSAFTGYVDDALNPALSAKIRPPIADGLAHFLRAPLVRERYELELASCVEKSRKASEAQGANAVRFQTHPPLHERIEALAGLPPGGSPDPDPPALSLVANWNSLERKLLGTMIEFVPREQTRWEDAAERLYIERYLEHLDPLRDVFAGLTIGDLGRDVTTHAKRFADAWVLLKDDGRKDLDPLQREVTGLRIGGCAIAVTLHSLGWRPVALPGEPIRLSMGDRSFEPLFMLGNRLDGSLDLEGWERRVNELGLGDVAITIPPREPEVKPTS